jgi:hypothetical protein
VAEIEGEDNINSKDKLSDAFKALLADISKEEGEEQYFNSYFTSSYFTSSYFTLIKSLLIKLLVAPLVVIPYAKTLIIRH